MRRIVLAIGAALGGVVALAAVAIVVLLVVDWNMFRPFLTEQASEASGRRVSIGHLSVDLSLTPKIRIDDLVIGNPDWARSRDMMRIRHADMVVRLWPLFLGRLEIDRMRLQGAEFHLEKQGTRDNWHFGATNPTTEAVKAVTPKSRFGFPVVRRLEITDGEITFVSNKLKQPIRAHFDTVAAGADGPDAPIRLALKGRYNRQPFEGTFSFGSYDALRAGTEPFPVKGGLRLGGLRGTLDGTVTRPLQFEGWDAQVSLSGRNFNELYRILDLPAPTSPPFELAGHVSKQGETWRLHDFRGRLGSTDLEGDIAVDAGRSPARLVADIRSRAVDLGDLKGFIGRSPGTKPPPKGDQPAQAAEPNRAKTLIPDEPFRLDKLRAMNVELTFDGRSVKAGGGHVINDLKLRLRLRQGKLAIERLDLGILDGTVSGTASVDASTNVPVAEARLEFNGLRLGKLLSVTGVTDASQGTFRGNLALKSYGNSMHGLAAHLDASGALFMEGGRISDLLLQLVALDLQQAIREVLEPRTDMIAIGCIVVPIEARDGRLVADPWVVSTPDTLLKVTGNIDLGTEKLRMRLLAQPKDYSFFNALTAIDVTGDLTHRTASVNKLNVAIKLVLKTLLAPLMPLLSPDIQQRAQAESPCAELSRTKAPEEGR